MACVYLTDIIDFRTFTGNTSYQEGCMLYCQEGGDVANREYNGYLYFQRQYWGSKETI